MSGVYLIRKSVDVDFSHHVRGHAGACINLHGHTWKLEVDIEASELDATGFVIDFGKLKSRVLKPSHALLDHALAVGQATYDDIAGELAVIGERLLGSRTPEVQASIPAPTPLSLAGAENRYPGGLKVAVFPFAPTSERLARWLYELADAELGDERVRVACGRVYETLHPVQAVAEYRPR